MTLAVERGYKTLILSYDGSKSELALPFKYMTEHQTSVGQFANLAHHSLLSERYEWSSITNPLHHMSEGVIISTE